MFCAQYNALAAKNDAVCQETNTWQWYKLHLHSCMPKIRNKVGNFSTKKLKFSFEIKKLSASCANPSFLKKINNVYPTSTKQSFSQKYGFNFGERKLFLNDDNLLVPLKF